MVAHVLQSSQGWRRGVFNRIAVFSTAPIPTFLALLFQLLLGLGVCKSKKKLDTIVFCQNRMEFSDDTLSNFATFKSGKGQY